MSQFDAYLLPTAFGQAEFTEKRSRFIGRVWPVESEDEALEYLRKIREKHWDATHNVYAYALRSGSVMRYSDDGEPQGSSGLPTLNVFRSAEISDFCCVVTRYFGGILLGTGGLARAYSQAASMALSEAGISEKRLWGRLLIECPYSLYEKLKKELEQRQANICSSDFGASVTVEALVKKELCGELAEKIKDVSSGAVETLFLGEEYVAVPVR
ncbi:MAG: YigZ family protein [Oscillospiraceae bacterium]|nr:YigZ family protein [Oscillospiraceae bacterium]